MIHPDQHRWMAQRSKATTREISASHVPFLSHPDEVAHIILEQRTRSSLPDGAQQPSPLVVGGEGQGTCCHSLMQSSFDEQREVNSIPLPYRLVIQSNGLGSYTLVNQGTIVGMLSDQETLKAYQDEFMTFAEYLKSIWE